MKDNILKITVVTFQAQEKISEKLMEFLDSYFEVSALNYNDDGKEEYVGYTDLHFNKEVFECQAKAKSVVLPAYKIEEIQDKNWLLENPIRFAPIEVGDFCIYDTYAKNAPQSKKIKIKVYAATAFGSTHQTTHLCLNALTDIAKTEFLPESILDIGTGSGILAITGAKKWEKAKPYILAVDIDDTSVNVAAQNVFDNDVSKFIDVASSNGLKAKIVRQKAPFDLVFANILANPLISMAKDIQKNIKSQGIVILSGFLSSQVSTVIKAYRKADFKLLKLYQKDEWCAALLQKTESISDVQKKLLPSEALLVCRNNMYLGEDVLDTENKIFELSGFSGSAGLMLILKQKAFLFVDGRYKIQARIEVKAGVTVVDSQNFFEDAVCVLKQCGLKELVINPFAVSVSLATYFKKQGITLKTDKNAPMSTLGSMPEIFKHSVRFAGLSQKEKCADIVRAFPLGMEALLICSPEEVSWLSNLRARDLPFTPVLRAFGLLDKTGKLKIYTFDKLKKLASDIKKYQNVMADFSKTPLAMLEICPELKDVHFEEIVKRKLQKNKVELEGFIKAHLKDGVALAKFLYDLEKNYQGTSELDIVQKLHDFRQKGKYYFSESFATIAAVGKNAAIVHYEPTSKTNKKLAQDGLLLLDSGAQYLDGTTDVTRTIAFGRVSNKIKEAFTEVLKAHIALAGSVFKQGTEAFELDQICRDVLLSKGKDYAHGTGHSVGHFSNVHEAPFAISVKNKMPVLSGFVTSIEPGYYQENAYGIRIENLVYVKHFDKENLCFEPLTLCPIDLNLIRPEMLTEAEKNWLNTYHQTVFEKLSPFLNKAERIWLQSKCRKI